jgi:Zn-dependent protease with chaperone function
MPKDWPMPSRLEHFEMAQEASLHDGDTAAEYRVTVEPTDCGLAIGMPDGHAETIQTSQLVRLYTAAGQFRFGRKDRQGWRLLLEGELEPAVAARLPLRTGSLAPRVSSKAAGIGFAGSALVVGMIACLFIAPHLAAQQMPMAIERQIGDSVKFSNYVPRCDNRQAIAAVEKVLDRLDPSARADGFTVELLGVSAVNAAALPGGRIVVLNGLIEEAGNADAVAGVLAHEIAHVRRHHVAAQAIRQLGVASLVSVMGGGDLSATAGGLLALKFGRDAETEADADAVAMLERAGINPRPTAFLFERMHKAEGNSIEWLASHPASDSRSKIFAESYRANGRYRPALEASDEDVLFEACDWPYLRYGEPTPPS